MKFGSLVRSQSLGVLASGVRNSCFCLHPGTDNLVVVAGVCFARNAILQIKMISS
jgi:hypothetical protein